MIPFSLWSEALWCGQEVVGELDHEQAIRSLFADPVPAHGADLDTVADLVPEPGDDPEKFAVAVRIGDRVVGYLPDDDARYYHPVLNDLVEQGLQPQVPCHVWASEWQPSDWEHRDSGMVEFHASVAIALGQPHMLAPTNLPPAGKYELLPQGAAVQVLCDDDRLDVIGPFLRPEGESWVHVTLHPIVAETGAKGVEVRLEGRRLGQLEPRVGADYLPAINYLAELRAVTAARAVIRGDRLLTEVVVYAARTQELPGTWPDGLERFHATGVLLHG